MLASKYSPKGNFAKNCPKGNKPKPSSINENYLLRKDGSGTMKVTIANHYHVHSKAI